MRFRFFKRAVPLLLAVFMLAHTSAVLALSDAQRKAISSGVRYFNTEVDTCLGSSTPLNGNDNIAKIYNYLLNKPVAGQPLKDFQVAGILGNMQHESGYQEQRLQGTASGVVTPAESLTPEQLSNPKLGWGLVQWTPVTKVINPLKSGGKNPDDLQTQLDFLLEQLNGQTPSPETAAGKAIIATTNVADATVAFETRYERHAGEPQPSRITEAERVMALVQSGAAQPTDTVASGKTIIALDPGHAGSTINRTDPETGLHDGDYYNPGETESVFAVSQMVKTQLEQAGYQVVVTKNAVTDSVFLRDRANIGNNAHAALGISIHTQGDKAFGTWQEIYTQKVGLYRGTGTNKQTFTDAALADKSQNYAEVMKQERDSIEVKSGTTVIKDNSFDGRGTIEPGNIPLVELWAKVPWIYLEAGGNNTTTGLTEQQRATYANAIVSGVKKAVPVGGAAAAGATCGSGTGTLPDTVLSYAWPEYHPVPYVEKKPEYEAAVQAAKAKGLYIGGVSYPGVDCGGFVTRVMLDSGFEPNYNYGGVIANGAGNVASGQAPWLRANWQLIGQVHSSSELKPGDVAIYKSLSHTYMYVGEIRGFGSTTASASLDERAPMAGKDDVTSDNIEWYRKK